jgi:putative two-component system response regulator
MSMTRLLGDANSTAVPGLSPKKLLIVDDDSMNRELLQCLVEMLGHTSVTAADGYEALAVLDSSIDLILMDIMMPGMDGYEVVRHIRSDSRFAAVNDVPIIMNSALTDREDRLCAVEAGANDFITKPVDFVELRVRTTSLLKMKEALDALKHHRQTLEETVAQRTTELRRVVADLEDAGRSIQQAHLETIQRLALAAEHRDCGTAAHLQRVSRYCAVIARALGLSAKDVEILQHASVLHDVGKIGISDTILLKPGALSVEERTIINRHAEIGAEILSGSSSPLLQAGETIARTHHERWDGMGYPAGLPGEQIPLFGRICAIADVFDALTSRRPYKEAFPLDRAIAILREGSGTHFDPRLLDLFLAEHSAVSAIWSRNMAEAAA